MAMTIAQLTATLPSDSTTFVDELGTYMRETRAKVNELITKLSTNISTDVDVTSADTELSIGDGANDHLADAGFEIVFLDVAAIGATISKITGGTAGQQKLLIIKTGAGDLTLTNNSAYFVLNNPTGVDLTLSAGDLIYLVCVDGTQWTEVLRNLKV